MHSKNRFKVYLKYTSLVNSWWTQSILKTYKSKLFFNYCLEILQNFITMNTIKIWNLIAINQHVFLEQLKPINWNFRGHYCTEPEISTYHWSNWNVYVQCSKSYIGLFKTFYVKINIPSMIHKNFQASYLQFHLYKMMWKMYHMMLSHYLQMFRYKKQSTVSLNKFMFIKINSNMFEAEFQKIIDKTCYRMYF